MLGFQVSSTRGPSVVHAGARSWYVGLDSAADIAFGICMRLYVFFCSLVMLMNGVGGIVLMGQHCCCYDRRRGCCNVETKSRG